MQIFFSQSRRCDSNLLPSRRCDPSTRRTPSSPDSEVPSLEGILLLSIGIILLLFLICLLLFVLGSGKMDRRDKVDIMDNVRRTWTTWWTTGLDWLTEDGERQPLNYNYVKSCYAMHIYTECFVDCSAQISVLKRKTLFNQQGSFLHREFHGRESRIGCPSFFILVLKIGRYS